MICFDLKRKIKWQCRSTILLYIYIVFVYHWQETGAQRALTGLQSELKEQTEAGDQLLEAVGKFNKRRRTGPE